MIDAATALQAALHDRLTADDALTALIGAGRIHDTPPRGAAFPFVAYDASEVRLLGGRAEEGLEHRLMVHVWSREGGKKETQAVLDAVIAAVEGLPGMLDGHRLANIGIERVEVRKERDGRTLHGTARVRAVTEPAG